MNINKVATGIIGLLIGVMLISSLGGTIVTNTASNAFNATGNDEQAGPLVNASSAAQTGYSIIELGWPLLGVMLLFGGGFGIVSGMKD